MLYHIYTSLDRIQSFTLDLNWNGSRQVHFGKRSQTGTDSGSVLVRIQQVQCKRKAYLFPYWYGSVWIRSSVNGVLVCAQPSHVAAVKSEAGKLKYENYKPRGSKDRAADLHPSLAVNQALKGEFLNDSSTSTL